MIGLVSVIIPIYQAGKFLESAVRSAINFSVVGEIILIEDGSSDDSYIKCQKLEHEYEQVRLLIHQNRKNLGASASRNLGIKESKFPYIAFLDADDFFLPSRFKVFESIVSSQESFDGLYEAIQYFNGSSKIYGISKELPPARLLYYLIRGTYGHFHTNGLIVKRDLLIEAGLFVESLDLHEDSDLWLKLAFYGKLISGKPGVPVSMVRKHEGNRIWVGTSAKSIYSQLIVTWKWAQTKPIGLFNKLLLLRKLIRYRLVLLISQ